MRSGSLHKAVFQSHLERIHKGPWWVQRTRHWDFSAAVAPRLQSLNHLLCFGIKGRTYQESRTRHL